MKNIRKSVVIIVTIALLALTAFSVLAAEGDEVIMPCGAGDLSGTVVGVDGDTVTIHTGDGVYCTVTLNGSYDHPIVSLLGMYFGDITADSLQAALGEVDTTVFDTCAVQDPVNMEWTWQVCPPEESPDTSEPVTILSIDETGLATAKTADGTIIYFMIDDAEYAGRIAAELAKGFVEWTVDENGDLVQVSDDIAAYHASGMGFGVLVKLYALAQDSDGELLVEDLVTEFNSGMGMGQIFKTYGKPSKLGVGHVRHDKNKNGNGTTESLEDGDQLDQLNNGQQIKQNKQLKQNKQNKENKQKGYCKPNKGKGKGRPGC